MAKAYYENLSDLMAQITPYIATDANLEIKHFFRGAAVFANGHICITLTPVGLAVKLPKELRKGVIERKEANRL